MSMACSAAMPLGDLAASLALGLRLELRLTPKPGLVDRWNSGAHADLNYAIMSRSIVLLEDYFRRCVTELKAGRPVERLRALGRETERRMWERFGTNTHRGAIFLGGLLLAGAHRAAGRCEAAVRCGIGAAARELFAARLPCATPGSEVRTRYRVGGVITEAMRGLPALFETAVPALGLGQRLGLSRRDARLLAMSRLMQTVEDTTTLRRCGELGLRRLRADGRRLEQVLLSGTDPVAVLVALDRRYRAMGMTMGGVADLLALSFAWHHAAAQRRVEYATFVGI